MTSPLFRTPSAVIHTALNMTLATGQSENCDTVPVSNVRTTISYRVLDPYALTMSFSYLDSPTIDWVCARDLVRDGFSQPSGEGDVRFSSHGNEMIIELISPEGKAQLSVNRAELSEFIDHIYEAVPAGSEPECFSIDDELEFLS